ncbi:MAG: Gfo/Idh/MocA family oxidoreductase [Acidobacteriota bacterium]
MLKVALAGLGAAGRTIHLPAIAKVPELDVCGASDPAVREAPRGIPVFASAQEMIGAVKPDVLAIASPPATHAALCRLGLEAGCHVVCEKPFVDTLEEAAALAALSRERGRWLVVNNQYRFMNIHREARSRVGKEGFGDLLFVLALQAFVTSDATETGWRGKETRRTCKEFGTHVLDLCRFFFDEEPSRIRARMPRAGRSGSPDLLNVIELEFSRDRMACIVLDRLSRGPHRYLDIRLDGSDGCIETSIGGVAELALGVKGGTRRPFATLELAGGGRAYHHRDGRRATIARDPVDLFATATSRVYAELCKAIQTGGTPPCHAGDNGRTLALMLAAYESAERGGVPIELAP